MQEHPEATFNLANCPHLIPAYLIDRALISVSEDIAKGLLISRGIPPDLNNEEQLNNVRIVLHEKIGALRLEEFFLIDVNKYSGDTTNDDNSEIIVKHTYSRMGSVPNR